jgi:hypothetical protein
VSGSDYFTYTNLVANQLARAGDVNARLALIQNGFGKLPHYLKLQQGRTTYCEDTGGANALQANLDFAPPSYSAGLNLTVKVAVSNSGPSTLNVNGLGAKAIIRADGSALAASDLVAGRIIHLIYDGTAFRLIGASEAAIAAAATSAANSAAAAGVSASNASGYAAAALGYRDEAAGFATAAANSATAAANSAAAAAVAVSGYAALAGAAFMGAVSVLAPTSNFHPATKKYVDDAVFAAGSVSADEASLHSNAGVFEIKSLAANRVLGSISAGVPTGLTGTQLATIVDVATTSLKGLLSAADKTKLDAITGTNTGDQIDVLGNAGTATALLNPRTIAISGAVTGAATSFNATANITIPITALDVGAATAGTLAVARGGTGVTTATGSGANVLAASPALTGTPTVPTAAAATNTTQAASCAFVQQENAGKAPAFLTQRTLSGGPITLADSDNNSIIWLNGGSSRTITANSTPTAGFSCILAVIAAGAWTFSCAGGVYVDGATSTVTSTSIAAGSRCTAIHKGSGVWLLTGS